MASERNSKAGLTVREDERILFAFRVDASIQIGTGHVMRCLTLADALRDQGAECLFLCREHPGNLIGHIRGKGYIAHALPVGNRSASNSAGDRLEHTDWLGVTQEEDAEECAAILEELRPGWLIVDHYGLDLRWEQLLRAYYERLMVIDDLADRKHSCDLLLDQNLGRKAVDYKGLLTKNCELLTGPKYALLRPEFAELRDYSLKRRSKPMLDNILITMGGVDQSNVTSEVLAVLKQFPLPKDCRINVVLGANAPWLQQVQAVAADMPYNVDVKVNVTDMAMLMADSDVAIGAAGSTAWERCCLGLPALIFILAQNQTMSAVALASRGAAVLVDKLSELPAQLSRLLGVEAEPYPFFEMVPRAATITDGKGAARVCDQLWKLIDAK